MQYYHISQYLGIALCDFCRVNIDLIRLDSQMRPSIDMGG